MRRFVILLLLLVAVQSGGQTSGPTPVGSRAQHPRKHFDRVLIVVLENQAYVAAIKDKYLKQLADEGVELTDFHAMGHPSYPNYLAMIAGSTFGMKGLFGDNQKDFPDDSRHRTIGDLLDWKNYAEDYPGKPGKPAYLYDARKYARKHVPFLSFKKIQEQEFNNVVSVNTNDPHNAFVTDVQNSRRDPKDSKYKPLPSYMFYSPNLDDDGHDTNLGTASTWLKNFMDNWFPPDARAGTLIVVTFDESEAPERKSNHIYTVLLGDMVKKGLKVDKRYNHYDILRTIEDNFGVQQLNTGDSHAKVITGIWNQAD
ncbi:MAG: alkaline phosphatase family protein [Terriglobales bacterium]